MISLGWKHPPNWIPTPPGNTFLLMVILIWIQVGFAMVVLGAALKAIPDEIVEAAGWTARPATRCSARSRSR